jgi:hypothetical protein
MSDTELDAKGKNIFFVLIKYFFPLKLFFLEGKHDDEEGQGRTEAPKAGGRSRDIA